LRLTSRDEKNGALMKGNTILLSENDPVVLTR